MLVCPMISQIPVSHGISSLLPHGKAVLFRSAAKSDEIHYQGCSASVCGSAPASSYFLPETDKLGAARFGGIFHLLKRHVI